MKYLWLMAILLIGGGCKMAEQNIARALPSEEGVDPAAIMEFARGLEEKMMLSGDLKSGNADSFLLMKNGRIIAEAAWAPFKVDTPRHVFSMSKGFTSTGVGFAVQEGLLSVDDKVIGFFPDKVPEKVSENLAAMTVRDLLMMQTGHEKCTAEEIFKHDDVATGFFAAEVKYKPGTHYVYNNGATYMLSAIITKVTGMPLAEYLKTRFFEPLGFKSYEWEADKAGINFGGWGLKICMEDAARFGQFYLQKGAWNGKQLLNREWCETVTSALCNVGAAGNTPDWQQGYGYQFWRGQHGSYRIDGYLTQYSIVMEKENAVLVLFGAAHKMQQPLDVLWGKLLPALQGKPSGKKVTDQELQKYLKTLKFEFPEKYKGKFKYTAGKIVEVALPAENELGVHNLVFEFGKNQVIEYFDGYQLKFGRDKWILNEPLGREDYPIKGQLLCRIFQQGPDELQFAIIQPGDAIQNYHTVKFGEDNVTIEGWWNFMDKPVTESGMYQ